MSFIALILSVSLDRGYEPDVFVILAIFEIAFWLIFPFGLAMVMECL